MNPHSWRAFGVGESYAPSAPAFVRSAMGFLVLTAAAAALSVRFLSASFASPSGKKFALITKVRQRCEYEDTTAVVGSKWDSY